MRRRIMSRRRLPTPAGPAEIARHNGLAYTLWLPDREPEGALLMVHGAGSQKENQHDIARAARTCGLAAICFDQRGHGASERPPTGYTSAQMADDFRALHAALGLSPAFVVGHSFGGVVGVHAASLFPESVRGRRATGAYATH